MAQANIETGVDKLVDLINRKQKITINDAAKELGVGLPVVQEWADFLEEEGLITVEENLRQTYLCERKLNKTEVEKKEKEYVNKKEAFVSKVEAAISSLQKESEGLSTIKQEFEKLKDSIGGDIDQVREELSELKHYEELKKNIDKEILQQRLTYQTMIEDIRKRIADERKKYESYIDLIGNERAKIEEAKVELGYLEKKEENLKKRVEALQEIIKSVNYEIDKQLSIIRGATSTIQSRIKEAEKVQKNIRYRIELEMEPIIKKTKDNEEKILAVQNATLQKIVAKNKEINKYKLESTEAAEKLRAFFEKRVRTQELIQALEKDKLSIEKEMHALIMKAKSFNLTLKASDVKKYSKELNEQFSAIEEKKMSFTKRLGQLAELITKRGN